MTAALAFQKKLQLVIQAVKTRAIVASAMMEIFYVALMANGALAKRNRLRWKKYAATASTKTATLKQTKDAVVAENVLLAKEFAEPQESHGLMEAVMLYQAFRKQQISAGMDWIMIALMELTTIVYARQIALNYAIRAVRIH